MTPFLDSAQFMILGVSALSALIVLWSCICTLNYMTPKTSPIQRISYVLLGVGAASMLLGPLYFDHKPTLGGTILALGVAVLLVTERLYTRKLRDRYAQKMGQPRRPWWE